MEEGVMMRLTTLDLAGRRVLRVGVAVTEHNGETDRRLILTAAWQDDPPVPLSTRTITAPMDALPELIAALEAIRQEVGA
jgi:hypothetical protein